ncbi:MAG: hypothetical protein HRT69_18885 [Flavobacteriaceae bacterium]|nr:hypothetical protein [Flavobacteriaceae bacterium]
MKRILKFILLSFILINCSPDDSINDKIEFQYSGKWRITHIHSNWVILDPGDVSQQTLGEYFFEYPFNHCGFSDSTIISYCESDNISLHPDCENYWEKDSYFEFSDNNTFKDVSDFYSVEVISDNLNHCTINKDFKIKKERTGIFEYTKDSIQLNYKEVTFPIFDNNFYSQYNTYIDREVIRDSIIKVSYSGEIDNPNHLSLVHKSLPYLSGNYYYYDLDYITLKRVEEN